MNMTLLQVKNRKKHGGSFPCACCRLFGRKGIEELLMILSSPTKQSNLRLCILLLIVLGCI